MRKTEDVEVKIKQHGVLQKTTKPSEYSRERLYMASPSDFSPGITSAGSEQFRRMGLSHLFQFDLSALKQTGQAFPERQDVSTIHHVLDVACGSGEWAIAVARANPHMQVVGIDNN